MPDDSVQRRLAAILCADVAGYSRLVDDDEVGTVRRLGEYRETLCSFVIRHHGRVVNAPGDAVLAEYQSVVDAVQSAVEIQRELEARNDSLPAEQRMSFRIGINLGDVIVENDDIYGEGVNIAARFQTIAELGGICISRPVHDQVHNKLTLGYEFLGERSVKNIAEPQGVFRIEMDPTAARRSKAPPRAAPDSSVAVGEGITTFPQSSRWIPPILVMSVLLGVLGVHRLYAGRIATGVLFFFTGGGLVIWWLVDIFQIIGGRFRDVDGNRFDRW